MDCVSCGLTIDPDDPAWAVYAWDAFEYKVLEAMALHEACYAAGETIEASWWENDEHGDPVLRQATQTRLLRAPGEGMFIWSTDPETGVGFLASYTPPRSMGGG